MVYRAEEKDGAWRVGIYVGRHPMMESISGETVEGQVGGQTVHWMRIEGTRSDPEEIVYETVFDYSTEPDTIPIRLHVWIVGRDEHELLNLKSRLADITLEAER